MERSSGQGRPAGDALAPGLGLGVEIVDIAPPAGGEEAGPDIANRPLHAPLLVAARDRDGLGQEVVVAGEVEDPGIEPDGAAAALQHDALQVVVPELAGHAPPRLEGFDMAAREVAHPGVEVEAREDPPRVAENHHEAHQAALRAADRHLAEVSPVDLGLLAGKGLEAQIGLGHGPGPLEVAEHDDGSGSPLRPDSRVRAPSRRAGWRAASARTASVSADERHVGIDHRAAWRRPVASRGSPAVGEEAVDGDSDARRAGV